MAFTTGALLPLLAIVIPPPAARIPVTFAVVIAALAVTGCLSARLGHAPPGRAMARMVGGGIAAMAVTLAAGSLVGSAVR